METLFALSRLSFSFSLRDVDLVQMKLTEERALLLLLFGEKKERNKLILLTQIKGKISKKKKKGRKKKRKIQPLETLFTLSISKRAWKDGTRKAKEENRGQSRFQSGRGGGDVQTRKQEEGGGELRRAERERKLVSRMEDRVDGKEVGRVPSARGMGRRARDHPLVKAEVSQAGIISFVRRRRVQRRGLSRRNRKRAHRQHRGGEPPPWRHPERKKGPREYLGTSEESSIRS